MANILSIHNEWRDSLQLASFRGIYFHVETSGRQSGRRTVTHQFPKRNVPYAEDMGREAVHWSFTAYILLNDKKLHASANHGRSNNAPYFDMLQHRNLLIEALEMDGPADLIHPSLSMSYSGGREGASQGGVMLVMCERYSISESRTKGGYYELDLQFVEAGDPPGNPAADNRALLQSSAAIMSQSAKDNLKKQLLSGNLALPGSRPGAIVGPPDFAGPGAIRKQLVNFNPQVESIRRVVS